MSHKLYVLYRYVSVIIKFSSLPNYVNKATQLSKDVTLLNERLAKVQCNDDDDGDDCRLKRV